jgi:hypothetical protein
VRAVGVRVAPVRDIRGVCIDIEPACLATIGVRITWSDGMCVTFRHRRRSGVSPAADVTVAKDASEAMAATAAAAIRAFMIIS